MADSHYLVVRKGRQFFMERARLCDHLYVKSRALVWFVWDAVDSYGNFPTMAKALAHIDHIVKGE